MFAQISNEFDTVKTILFGYFSCLQVGAISDGHCRPAQVFNHLLVNLSNLLAPPCLKRTSHGTGPDHLGF